MVLARQLPSSTWLTPPTRVRVPQPQCCGRSSFNISSRYSRTYETYPADKQTPRRDIRDNPTSLLSLIPRSFAAAFDPYRDQPTFSSTLRLARSCFHENDATEKTLAIVLIFSHDATPGLSWSVCLRDVDAGAALGASRSLAQGVHCPVKRVHTYCRLALPRIALFRACLPWPVDFSLFCLSAG